MASQAGRVPRLLHVTATDQRRGAEVFAADLVAGIAGVDHRVAVLRPVPPGPGRIDFACPIDRLDLAPGPAGLAGGARSLRAVTRAFSPDVVQAHGGEQLRLAVLAGLHRRCPVVYRRIGKAPAAILTGWRRQWHRGLMRRAATVVCVSEDLRIEAVERLGLDPARTVTIPNAVAPGRVLVADPATARAEVRAELGVPAGATVVLSLGALSPEKDPLGAIEATAPLLGGEAPVVHVFAGDGPEREPLAARARASDVQGHVVLAGPRDDVGRVLAAADLVLLASRSEGMPATVIEAGLAGLPVVATDVAGVREVVVHRETGLVVPAGDGGALRAAVAALVTDPARRRRLGRAAAERCRARFTIEAVAGPYARVWEAAAGGAAGRIPSRGAG